jgi:tRNA (adenine22-N1)-methyltransferase
MADRAIASDINEGPIIAAQRNIKRYSLTDRIETRIGPGLSTLSKNEADVIVIAGMGGVLIADILDEGIDIARTAESLILQPVQYPEVLRKYVIGSGFKIVDEDIVKEDKKYYHIIKMVNEVSSKYSKEVYYYTGEKLIEKGHPLIKEFIEYKINRFESILKGLSPLEQSDKYNEFTNLKKEFEDVLKCL